jgi:methionyl-tRNA formyltransferase
VKISIICSDSTHPVNKYLLQWIDKHSHDHEIELIRKKSELTEGSILFLVSCGEILTESDRASYGVSLVLHASDLPRGRGWSPHIWELADGATSITLSLIEAQDKVDSGNIWKKIHIAVPATYLWDEINHLLFMTELELMDFALKSYGNIESQTQSTVGATYFRLRTREDSRLDVDKTIAAQFDLIRICDPIRFPAFFEYRGQKYTLKLEKLNDE